MASAVCATDRIPGSSTNSNGLSFDTSSDADGWGKDNFGSWFDELSENSQVAMKSYITSSDHINSWLRKGAKRKAEIDKLDDWVLRQSYADIARGEAIHPANLMTTQDKIAFLDEAFSVPSAIIPENIVVYRTISHASYSKPVGTIFKDKGFVSTSLTRDALKDFTEDFRLNNKRARIFEIRVPKGSSGAWIDSGSTEVLLNRNTRFRVVADGVLEVVR